MNTPTANTDGTYLPMPLTGARRIENERLLYREHQRLHHEKFSEYAAGWRRPSETTVSRVWELVNQAITCVVDALSPAERAALVVALDAAIQAGEDGRLLTHNLVFDEVAAGWSDWYRSTIERGPARISWEMSADVLKAAWRDLLRNEIYLEKLIPIAQHGCGLYTVAKGHDDKYTVKLTQVTARQRRLFLDIIAADATTGGTYRRRTSTRRLRLPKDDTPADEVILEDVEESDDLELDAATTHKVVAGVPYNVAVPGARSLEIIRKLEGARLYLNAEAVQDEYRRLGRRHDGIIHQALKLGVDVTMSVAKTRIKVKDAGTGEMRDGFTRSPWRRHLTKVLWEKFPKRDQRSERDTLEKRAIALAEKYDNVEGQARQLHNVVMRVRQIAEAGGLDRYGDVEICSRYAKLVNRRYQALDFWYPEVSGKDEVTQTSTDCFLAGYNQNDHEIEADVTGTTKTSRRGRLFSVAASRSIAERDRLASNYPEIDWGDSLNDRQDLFGVDVSGSQIQIYAVLLGLRRLETRLQKMSFKEIAALRAWQRHRDKGDPFRLPAGYKSSEDPRLMEATKSATMTWLYGSPPAKIVERLAKNPDAFGSGLGTPRNLSLFLHDQELELDTIARRWKRACWLIAARAWKMDPYAGAAFADPFDGSRIRWNPVRWKLDRVAGSDAVRIYAKVPLAERFEMAVSAKTGRRYPRAVWEPADPDSRFRPAGYAGDFPVYRHKLGTTFGPCFIHTLDSLFCGLVIEELADRGVHDVIAVHDAWYVPADAESKLKEAVEAAGRPWFVLLSGVYDDLERLLGTCTPLVRGKNKGRCCGFCANWIRELRETWRARVEAADWPKFRVGAVRPVIRD